MRRWLMLLCLPAVLQGSLQARAGELPEDPPLPPAQVTVRLYNHAALPPHVLAQATEVAGKIIREAGVQVVWWNCAGPTHRFVCDDPLFPADYRIFLHPKEAETKMPVSANGLGFVLHDPSRGVGRTAWILFARVERLAERERLPTSVLLGHVLAHELGHMLLGAVDHRGNGLMRGRWDEKELRHAAQGGLAFTGPQAKAIRAALRRRPRQSPSLLAMVSFVPR